MESTGFAALPLDILHAIFELVLPTDDIFERYKARVFALGQICKRAAITTQAIDSDTIVIFGLEAAREVDKVFRKDSRQAGEIRQIALHTSRLVGTHRLRPSLASCKEMCEVAGKFPQLTAFTFALGSDHIRQDGSFAFSQNDVMRILRCMPPFSWLKTLQLDLRNATEMTMYELVGHLHGLRDLVHLKLDCYKLRDERRSLEDWTRHFTLSTLSLDIMNPLLLSWLLQRSGAAQVTCSNARLRFCGLYQFPFHFDDFAGISSLSIESIELDPYLDAVACCSTLTKIVAQKFTALSVPHNSPAEHQLEPSVALRHITLGSCFIAESHCGIWERADAAERYNMPCQRSVRNLVKYVRGLPASVRTIGLKEEEIWTGPLKQQLETECRQHDIEVIWD